MKATTLCKNCFSWVTIRHEVRKQDKPNTEYLRCPECLTILGEAVKTKKRDKRRIAEKLRGAKYEKRSV